MNSTKQSTPTNLASLLTPRQLEVLELIRKGMSSRLISQHLGLSIYTVKEHRAAILRKMGATNVVDLINKVNTLRDRRLPLTNAPTEKSSKPRLIVVDDDTFYRILVTTSLQMAGYDCDSAACSAELYAIMQQQVPDIVLLDLNLENEDGLDIAKALRSQQSVGIIMVTTRSMIDQRIDGLSSGADAYLAKPPDMRELVAVIKNLYLRMNEWRATRAPDTHPGQA